MSITDLIVELLQNGQKVELSGIGTFDSEVQSPHLDPASHTYYPATRRVVFSTATAGDTSIVHHIAEHECVGEEVALQMWHNYVDALTDKLSRSGEHRFGELGTLLKSPDGYHFTMAEGVVIDASNGNDVPLEEVKTYDHSDSEDPFAQFEEEQVPTPEPEQEPAPEPEQEQVSEPAAELVQEPESVEEPAPTPAPEPEPGAEAPQAGDNWQATLKKLDELPKSKEMLKAEAKEEKRRRKAEAKAEKEKERLRKLEQKEREEEARAQAKEKEEQERKEAEERRRQEEEIRNAELKAAAYSRKAEKNANTNIRKAEEMADEERLKAEKRAAVFAAVAATTMVEGNQVAGESVNSLAPETLNEQKEVARRQKEQELIEKAAAKAAAKEASRLRKEEKKRQKAERAQEKQQKKKEKKDKPKEHEIVLPHSYATSDENNDKSSHKWIWWLIILLLLLLLVGGGYFFMKKGVGFNFSSDKEARTSMKHLDVPRINAFTYNPDMIEYNAREISRSCDLVCANMTDYVVAYLAQRGYRNARVPMMDRVRQYADERLNQLLGERFAVQRFIPYNDYVYNHCELWLKQTYARESRLTVQGELMDLDALDAMLDQLIEELGLRPGEAPRTAVEVQQAKAAERPAPRKTTKANNDANTPNYVYVEKGSKQGFDIIAGFYLNKTTAANMTARLHEQGCDAYIIEKNEMYYVSMGSAPTRTKAEALYDHIKEWYDGDIVIKQL